MTGHLSLFEKSGVRLQLLRSRLREYMMFDSGLTRRVVGLLGLLGGLLLYHLGRRKEGLVVLTRIHQHDLSNKVSDRIERFLRQSEAMGEGSPLRRTYLDYVASIQPTSASSKFFAAPDRMFRHSAMILKSYKPGERGVLLLTYSYLYPLFAQLFDVSAIVQRYYIALETDWTGHCDMNILPYAHYGVPVFVEAIEPRDTRVLQSVSRNLIPVPIGSNWWVDHRIMRPLPGISKDIDVCMLAGWAGFKRHWSFFRALRRLRRKGVRLRGLLIGYPMDSTRKAILRQADFYGVTDQLEIHERLPAEEVNYHLNRSKVTLLCTRREGVNRAIIEGMFANVPCVVREGWNYGYRYPYINAHTGRFSTEEDLPKHLVDMVESHHTFRPRQWVLENMTCHRGTAILNAAIRTKALESGQEWTEDLAVKVSHLNGTRYWDDSDDTRFKHDYEFLHSCIRSSNAHLRTRSEKDHHE